MGASQTAKEMSALVEKALGIHSSLMRTCVTDRGVTVSCLIHESWLKDMISGNQEGISTSKYYHPSSEYERQLMLQPSHAGPYPPWARICIKVLQKPVIIGNSDRSISLRLKSEQDSSEFTRDSTVSELLQGVNQEACRHNWNEALKKYSLAMSNLPKSRQQQFDGKEIIRNLVKKVFGLSVISLGSKDYHTCPSTLSNHKTYIEPASIETETSSAKPETGQCNVIPLVCVLENSEAFFFIEPFFRHGLQDISTFSPAVMSHSTIRLMYIIYQVLNALHWYHQNNVTFGKLDLDSIRLDKGLFLYLTTPSFKDIFSLQIHYKQSDIDINDSLTQDVAHEEIIFPDYDLQKPKHDLAKLVEMWVSDEISNFDYLMALNYFAGRRQGDPNYHPLFPWVTDFTDKNGGYRDLTKSKFRLNKGDNQLDMTYKHALFDNHEGGGTAVAHHVSDVLSDITYHAYLARRTPVSVLCEHLRSNWVPNEYPSSMQRLYTWTPDECIPQFYSDTSIFKSIHPDLPDLELPSWTPTAEEFIKWHRSVLESEEVSHHLHLWIDLTFGYKLSGKAAVKAKNVCLHLVNRHQSVNNYGIVQLFNKPHPRQTRTSDIPKLPSCCHAPLDYSTEIQKESSSAGHLSIPSYLKSNLNNSLMSLDSNDDEGCHDTGLHSQTTSEPHNTDTLQTLLTFGSLIGAKEAVDENFGFLVTNKISLPEECAPLHLLDTYESMKRFKRQFPVANDPQQTVESPKVVIEDSEFDKLIESDIEGLSCLIVEMVLPEKVRLVSAGLSQEQKAEAIKHLCSSNPKILPRFVRSGVLRMLKLRASQESSICEGMRNYAIWEGERDCLPFLSTELLLHPQTGLFPFPSYFKELHSFLVKFAKARLIPHFENQQKLERSLGHPVPRISLEGLEYCFSNKSEYSINQVDIVIEMLPSLLPELDDEGVHLLLYHLEPLFLNQETRLYAFTHLFDLLAQAIGPKATAKTFLKPLIELYDSKILHEYKVLAAQSFLSQIIVRFGLENFLTHFVSFVVDAVAFELMLQKPKSSADCNSFNSNEGVTGDGGESEAEKSKKHMKKPLFLSDDEDEDVGITDAPFSDQEDDDYTLRIDEPFEEQDLSKPLLSCQESSEDAFREEQYRVIFVDGSASICEDKSKVVGQVVAEESVEENKTDQSRDHDLVAEEMGYGEAREIVLEHDMDDHSMDRDFVPEDIPDEQGEGQFSIKDRVSSLVKQEQSKEEDDKSKEIEFEKGNFGEPEESENKCVLEYEKDISVIETKKVASNDATIDIDETNQGLGGCDDSGGSEEKDIDDDVGEVTSGDSSDDEMSDNFLNAQDSESNRPSADVFFQDSKADNEVNDEHAEDVNPSYVSGTSAESVMWLAPRLGPILTSKFLANRLLTMLPQCYIDAVGVEEYEFEDEDRIAKWVLYCLGNFCALYGEAFILHQYLPYAEKMIKSIHTKFSVRGEASLAAVFALLKYCAPYMSKQTLVDNFETLFKTLFQPVLRILSSWNTKFPGGGDARSALCHNYVDLLTVLSLKLERELARELMTAPLQQFFSCFELVHMKKKEYKLGRSSFIAVSSSVYPVDPSTPQIPEEQGLEGDITKPEQIEAFYKTSMYEELCQTFSAAMAYHAFVPLCGIMGSKFMEASLYNHELIWNLCSKHDPQLSHPGTDDVGDAESRGPDDITNDQKPGDECDAEVERVIQEGIKERTNEDINEGEDKGHSAKKGSRIRTPSWLITRRLEKRKSHDMGKPEVMSASDQYLRGTWLDYWQHQTYSKAGSHRSYFNLQQIKLQTFTGHSGPVRSIYVQDSEHFFLSASKDKTVKLWSLSNHGDGTAQSASSWTYYRHPRGVFAVDMIESVRQAVSCDGSVHIWDPQYGSTIAILELNKNSSVVAMAAMPAPSQSVVVATSEATARFIDVRQSCFVQEWKTTTSSAAGSVRDICCSPDGRWIALGFSSGLVSVLDVRGGLLRSQRRAHTSDVFQVRAFSNNSLLTSSMDQGLSLWKDDGLRLKNIKGHTEPLHILIVQKDYILSSSIANRIGVHITKDEPSEGSYTSFKLASEVLRGNLTSLGYLQLNQLLLLGSDTGNITLCA